MLRVRACGCTALLCGLLLGCSAADFCEAGERCSKTTSGAGSPAGGTSGMGGATASGGSGEPTNGPSPEYAQVLANECSTLCAWLEACDVSLYTSTELSCPGACQREAFRQDYWPCEPAYRRMLACFPEQEACNTAPCASHVQAYSGCLSDAAE